MVTAYDQVNAAFKAALTWPQAVIPNTHSAVRYASAVR